MFRIGKLCRNAIVFRIRKQWLLFFPFLLDMACKRPSLKGQLNDSIEETFGKEQAGWIDQHIGSRLEVLSLFQNGVLLTYPSSLGSVERRV